MKWGTRDVLSMSDYRKPGFWFDMFKDRSRDGDYKGKKSSVPDAAEYVVTRALELAWNDMIENGEEWVFMTKKRVPFLIFAIKDFKFVKKFYKYNHKFRGNDNRILVFTYPSLLKRAKIKKIDAWLEYFLYLRLSKQVQNGMDYPAMPDMNVYREMRAPYHDRSNVKLQTLNN